MEKIYGKMLIGTDYKSIDNKGRVTIPVKWRNDICPAGSEGVYSPVFLQFIDGHFILWNYKAWDEGTAFTQSELANCEHLTVDKHGRILIPKRMIEDAELNGEVVFKGAGAYLEIYSKHNIKTNA